MTAVRVADYIMQALAQAGVGHAFLLPGGGAMHLNDALARSAVEAVPCHHEQACGIAAEAYGRMTQNIGVAMVTSGPGATNVITPVAGGWIESAPMLVISGQVKRADRKRNAPLRQKGVQEVDIVAMVQSVTKYAVTVDEPTRIRYHLEKALYLARHGRRGPVWLDIPLDVQAALIDPQALEPFESEAVAKQVEFTQPLVKPIAQLMAMLAQAKRPLILAGHGVRLAGAAEAFRALIERLRVPVVTTWNALDLLPFDHPLYVGRPGVVALRAPNFAVQSCDLLISIGSRLDNVLTAYDIKNFAPHARKCIVDVDPHELAKFDVPIELPIVADAVQFIQALATACADARIAADDAWLGRLASWKQRYTVLDGAPFPTSGTIGHFHFVDALSDALPPGVCIATGSSGLAVEAFYTAFRNRPGQRVFLTSGLGAMGYGLAAAIGACLGTGRGPVIAVESDGSLMLNLQELATLKALGLPIVLFVMNNNGYASIRNTQRNYFQGRFIGTGPEAGLYMPDFCAVASAFGLPSMRIERVEDLSQGLQRALASARPCVCEVRLRENETLSPKVSAIPLPDGSIISMPLEDMSPLLPLSVLRDELGTVAPASVAARQPQRA